MKTETLSIKIREIELKGDLTIPDSAKGIVIFAHGSGSSRLSPRNRQVASALNQESFATLLFDLLTSEEEMIDNVTAELRFDIPLLATRLKEVTDWILNQPKLKKLALGYFGASTGAAASLMAAAGRKDIKAIVSRGGRPDLAGEYLKLVNAPTLLIVGGLDYPVIEMNQSAQKLLLAHSELKIVEGATHLFEEAGKLDEVTQLAIEWFKKYLG